MMGKDNEKDKNNKDDGKHNIGDDRETGKQADDFDLSEYDNQ
ncbi:MAG: hypothetical protein ACT4NY_26830 [Pseudonocardiales bacterium]